MSRYTKTIALCAATLFACVTVANANAADAPAAAPAAAGAPWHHRGGMQHDLDKIHAQLHLTADQEQQWQAAVAGMKAAHEQEHAAHQQSRQQMQALMQAPVLDLRAIHAAREQNGKQAQQLRAQTTETWLKFYDTLNTTQKTQVSTMLKAKWQKMAARREKMAAHWQKMHHDAPASQAQ